MFFGYRQSVRSTRSTLHHRPALDVPNCSDHHTVSARLVGRAHVGHRRLRRRRGGPRRRYRAKGPPGETAPVVLTTATGVASALRFITDGEDPDRWTMSSARRSSRHRGDGDRPLDLRGATTSKLCQQSDMRADAVMEAALLERPVRAVRFSHRRAESP